MRWWLMLRLTVKVELLQLSRSRKFWLMMALAAILSWLFFPAENSSYQIMLIDGQYRGPHNSAWYGMMLAMLSLWWSLLGFYFLRGSIRQDIESKVWELLASSQLNRLSYVLAKWCSQLLIYSAVLLLQLLLALVLQQLWAEHRQIDVLELVKPVLLISLPSLALTSALVLWFDLIPKLRHTAGNVIFFAIWLGMLIANLVVTIDDGLINTKTVGFDPRGMLMMQRAIAPSFAQLPARPLSAQPATAPQEIEKPSAETQALQQQRQQRQAQKLKDGWVKERSVILLGFPLAGESYQARKTFDYPRWQLSYLDYLNAAIWSGVSLTLVFFASFLPDRFASRLTQGGSQKIRSSGKWGRLLLSIGSTQPFVYLWLLELSQVFRQRSWWWWALLLATIPAQLLLESALACSLLLLCWLPLLSTLSSMAFTEQRYHSDQYLMIAPKALWRLATARVLTAVGMLALTALPLYLRFALTDPSQLPMLLSGTVLLAMTALACGIWSRQSRLFELIFLLMAYLGINQMSPIFQHQQTQTATLLQSAVVVLALLLFLSGWHYRNQRPQSY